MVSKIISKTVKLNKIMLFLLIQISCYGICYGISIDRIVNFIGICKNFIHILFGYDVFDSISRVLVEKDNFEMELTEVFLNFI